jgi:hypothetical protein
MKNRSQVCVIVWPMFGKKNPDSVVGTVEVSIVFGNNQHVPTCEKGKKKKP